LGVVYLSRRITLSLAAIAAIMAPNDEITKTIEIAPTYGPLPWSKRSLKLQITTPQQDSRKMTTCETANTNSRGAFGALVLYGSKKKGTNTLEKTFAAIPSSATNISITRGADNQSNVRRGEQRMSTYTTHHAKITQGFGL
jgi:hypothetical protein